MSSTDSEGSGGARAASHGVLSRRQLLQIAGTAGVLLVGGLFVNALLALPSVTDPLGKQVRVALKSLRFVRGVAGPIAYAEGISVFVTRNDTQWLALDQRCPHMQCTVAWHADQAHFVCPCHGSTFNQRGDLVHGPATRGMFHHQVLSESDALVIAGLV